MTAFFSLLLEMGAKPWMKVKGVWERTTSNDLPEFYRFPPFLTINQVEFAMDAQIMREEDVAALKAA